MKLSFNVFNCIINKTFIYIIVLKKIKNVWNRRNREMLKLHIPDGFLDPVIAISTYIISLIVITLSFLRSRGMFEEEKTPLISAIAGSIFVAQLLDWPIPGGTTAHYVGSALVSIIVGPFIGVIVMSLVLFFQALIFQDGGITSLGANILNMGVIGCFLGYFVFKFSSRILGERKLFWSSFLAGWFSIVGAAIACGFEIGLSTQFKYGIFVSVPAMAISHGLLGILEGLITAFVVDYLAKYRPDILPSLEGEIVEEKIIR